MPVGRHGREGKINQLLSKVAYKYGLRHSFKYELPISKEEFEIGLYDFVDKEKFFMFSNQFSEKHLLYGTPENNELVLKKRRGMLEIHQMIPKTTCTYHETDGVLIIEGQINGLRFSFLLIAFMVMVLYSLILALAILGKLQDENLSWFVSILISLVFIVAHGSMFVVFPFYRSKRSVRMIKEELEIIFGDNLSAKDVK